MAQKTSKPKCPDCKRSKYIIEKSIGNQPTLFCTECMTVISYQTVERKDEGSMTIRDYNISPTAKLDTYHHLDNIEGMKQFPDNYFDLAIVDPPYGIDVNSMNLGSGKYKTNKTWDTKPPPPEYFDELFRVSRHQIIWGANHFISLMPFDASCWIVWNKRNGTSDFADGELAWTSFNRPVRMFSFSLAQQTQEQKKSRFHATAKPIQLYMWILKNFAKQTDIILDTHVGSANSLVAFEAFGCKYCGYEIDREYYAYGTENVNKHREGRGERIAPLEEGQQVKLAL